MLPGALLGEYPRFHLSDFAVLIRVALPDRFIKGHVLALHHVAMDLEDHWNFKGGIALAFGDWAAAFAESFVKEMSGVFILKLNLHPFWIAVNGFVLSNATAKKQTAGTGDNPRNDGFFHNFNPAPDNLPAAKVAKLNHTLQ
jgi:hypothetical protein